MHTIERREIFIESKETLSYRFRQGGKQLLLLLHDNLSSSRHFDHLMENISDEYTIYALDLRGFGNSSYLGKVTSMRDFSEDVKDFADAIGINTFVLTGWGLGGNVAMRFAIDYNRYVEKLILLSSHSVKGHPLKHRYACGLVKSSKPISTLSSMQAHVKRLEMLKFNDKKPAIYRYLNKTLYTNKRPSKERYHYYVRELKMQRNMAETQLALSYFNISTEHNGLTKGTNEAHKLTMPTLIIHGTKDKVVPLRTAYTNAQAIGENAVIHIIKGGDHALMLGTLGETLALIETFI